MQVGIFLFWFIPSLKHDISVVAMSRDIDEIPHPIKKLTDGIEFHDMSSQLTAGLGARLRGCSRGRFGDKDTASGLVCFPLSSSLGLQRLHSSGSASQAVTSSDLPQCRRKLHLGKNASGLGGMDSFHSSLLHTFYLLLGFNSARIC